MTRGLFLSCAFLALVAAAPSQAQTANNQLPPGDGRDIVASACTQCHGLNLIVTLRESESGWRFHVYDMVVRGAQLNSTDADKVVDYLSTTFAPGVPVPGPKPTPVSLPDGPGKDLVETRCVACHDLGRLAGDKRTDNEWDGILVKMISIGAPVTPDEAKTIGTYLHSQLGVE